MSMPIRRLPSGKPAPSGLALVSAIRSLLRRAVDRRRFSAADKAMLMDLLMVADNDPVAQPILSYEVQTYLDWEAGEYRAGRLATRPKIDKP